jgi:hypothetical protein
MSLDLNKLENKLDEALSNETSESLNKFLNDKRMTNNKQQTAVDSIIELCQELLSNHYSISHDGVCSEIIRFCQEQAKEMEKEQIINAFWNGDNTDCTSEQNIKEFAEQYYEQTYGGGEQ